MSEQSADIYDALAPYYREYAGKKSAYLASVDGLVLENIPDGANSLLDVGSGDGVRGMAIAKRKGIGYTVLCEPSAKMADLCRKLGPSEMWQKSAGEISETSKHFDVILCLWNVLGHIPGRTERVKALTRMRTLLSDGGAIYIDVNNRHNASAYGALTVILRRAADFIAPYERRGDTCFEWKVGGKVFPAMGHLFTPCEINGIIRESGLSINKMVTVDYADGKVSESPYRGQLFFMLGINDGVC